MVSTYQSARRYIQEHSHLQFSRISCLLLPCHLILLDYISLKKVAAHHKRNTLPKFTEGLEHGRINCPYQRYLGCRIQEGERVRHVACMFEMIRA
jgi:hypothetical protein